MTSIVYLHFLPLLLCFAFSITLKQKQVQKVALHIINDLPESSDILDLGCRNNGYHKPHQNLTKGDVYRWDIEETKLYNCDALWEKKMVTWAAYDSSRDSPYEEVFWAVKGDGIYLSYKAWDKSTWKKSVNW
ncbi:hypothetical protein Acr_01g0012400 [Actinidia rufa]|uniref:Plant self-incompatibility protein S1 family n=1 Tax=Actinidia rufa TaxID=165716 RepID=A0A7J0E4L7_9ERIC|nr:hypothetical protein Acr_01g0012400 [Actinidia rufa]